MDKFLSKIDNIKKNMGALKLGSNFEQKLFKATYIDDKEPPKEKHVQYIV
jgi:hypothetical protein